MHQKITELIIVYEDYKDVVKTDYVSKLAFLVGLIAVLSTLISEFLFRILDPNWAYWVILILIASLFLKYLHHDIKPLSNEHKRLRKIVNNLRHFSVKGDLNKSQIQVLDLMWKEAYRVNNWDKTLSIIERNRYYSKIEGWMEQLYKFETKN